MGMFDYLSGSAKSNFDSDMAEIAQQLVLSLGKIQEGMRNYLHRYCQKHGIRSDSITEEETFGWLESGVPPTPDRKDLAKEYVEVLKTHPLVKQVFSTAMVFKINSMTSRGLMADAMKLVDNLNRLGLPPYSLSVQIPSEKAFITMANDFYESSKSMEAMSESKGFSGDRERYRIDSELGRGSFGVVFEAYDNRLQRKVAIKRLAYPRDKNITRNYESEAQKIAQLNHSGIVQVYDMERSTDGIRIIMEYVDGGSLRDLLQFNGGSLTESAAVKLFTQLCGAMAHAHDQGIIHRDLKPENIFVSNKAKGVIKIGDFGLALLGGVDAVSCSGRSGSPLYMAPEQVVGGDITGATDVYAMGKIFHEMLTGELGLIVDTESACCPIRYRGIIARCVERQAVHRYRNASELLEALSSGSTKQGE